MKERGQRVYLIFEENDYPHYQDHAFWRGIPAGVKFEVRDFRPCGLRTMKTAEGYKTVLEDGVLWLTAPGYGGEPYGNGAIAVRLSSVFGSRCEKAEDRQE